MILLQAGHQKQERITRPYFPKPSDPYENPGTVTFPVTDLLSFLSQLMVEWQLLTDAIHDAEAKLPYDLEQERILNLERKSLVNACTDLVSQYPEPIGEMFRLFRRGLSDEAGRKSRDVQRYKHTTQVSFAPPIRLDGKFIDDLVAYIETLGKLPD